MWLMTTLGFFSVVCARQADGGWGNPVDKTRVMIRARNKRHLESLRSRFPKELKNLEIVESLSTDYRWRLFCPKDVWAACITELVRDTDYDNFKDACAEIHGQSSPYLHALHETWSTFNTMGRNRD